MQWYVVLRTSYFKYPPRHLKEISRFRKMDENTWSYLAKDLDYKENAHGFVEVFKREDAARRCYENVKGMDGKGSSVYLIFAKSLTKKGAAQRALGCILFGGYKKGEILDAYHHEQEKENSLELEVKNGN
jgi:hypothetical protein